MTREDLAGFVEELQRVAEALDVELSEGRVAVYFDVLAPYSFEDVARALRAHLRNPDTGQFFPKPADVVRFIEGDTQSRALVSWTRANRANFDVGQYESVDFGDPALHRVIVDMGGWPAFCCWPEEERPFKQKEFCDRYRAITARGVPFEAPEYLVGIHELNNRGAFPDYVPLPVLVNERGLAPLPLTPGGPGRWRKDLALPAAEAQKALSKPAEIGDQ